jgi:hypothetical protein
VGRDETTGPARSSAAANEPLDLIDEMSRKIDVLARRLHLDDESPRPRAA